jgi:hypothetical protein
MLTREDVILILVPRILRERKNLDSSSFTKKLGGVTARAKDEAVSSLYSEIAALRYATFAMTRNRVSFCLSPVFWGGFTRNDIF